MIIYNCEICIYSITKILILVVQHFILIVDITTYYMQLISFYFLIKKPAQQILSGYHYNMYTTFYYSDFIDIK